MLYAELGRSPINLQIKKRMLGYWISILNGSDAKIVKKMYQILYNDFVNRGINHKWIGKIRQILISVGKPDLLHQHNIQHPLATKLKISQTLHDIFLQDWNVTTNTGAQWLSGRVLDSRPKGRGVEPHRRHCVVVLEQDTFILA